VKVPIGAATERFLLPLEAVQSDQRGDYVLTVGQDDSVAFQPITLGQREGNLVVVASGLAADDRVIVNGIQKAPPGGKVQPQEQDLKVETAAKPARDNDTQRK